MGGSKAASIKRESNIVMLTGSVWDLALMTLMRINNQCWSKMCRFQCQDSQALQDSADLTPTRHEDHDPSLNTLMMDHCNHLKYQLKVNGISLAEFKAKQLNKCQTFLISVPCAFSLCTLTTSCSCSWLNCGKARATERGSKGTPGSGPCANGELRPELLERHASRSGKWCRKSSKNTSWMG